jgi:hypothetical protein
VKYLDQVAEKADRVSSKVLQRSEKALQTFQKQEEKIYKKLLKVDSVKANAFLKESQEKYTTLKKALTEKRVSQYFGGLDTLKTSVSFLQSNQNILSGNNQVGKLNTAVKSIEGLEGSLGNADRIKTFLRERKSQLKTELASLPRSKELIKLNKEAYYYFASKSLFHK